MKNWKTIFVLTLFANSAHAGDGAGNGDVVVCFAPDGGVRTVELLDYFERRNDPSFALDLGPENSTVEQKVQYALDRLRRLDPERQRRYEAFANEFVAQSHFVDTPLEDYHTVGQVVLPPHCKLDQLAIQRPSRGEHDKPIRISSVLWRLLKNDDHRAGLRIHEIVYREALALGHRTSIAVRKFTALLSSRAIESLTDREYSAEIEQFSSLFPKWVLSEEGELTFDLKVGQAFAADLSRYLEPRDHIGALSWSLSPEAPPWLNLSHDGRLTGVPRDQDVGEKKIGVVIRDEEKGALAILRIRVGH